MKEALSWLVVLGFMSGFLHFLFRDVPFIVRHPRTAWRNLTGASYTERKP